jgi:hypothetical protein
MITITFKKFSTISVRKFQCAVRVWTDESDRFLLCELEDGVVGNMDSFLFTSKGSPTLKYINDITDRIGEAGIYIQFTKQCVHSNKLTKNQNISKIIYSYICMCHTHSGGVLYLAVGICIGSCVYG